MATIQVQIEAEVGEATGADIGFSAGQLQDAYNDGLRAVIMPLPEPAWKFFGKNEIDFSPLIGTPLTNSKIIAVLRNDGGVYRKCVEVDQDMFAAAQDINSLDIRSAFRPAYTIESGGYSDPRLKVVPEGSGDEARLVCVAIPTVDITTDTIVPHFPDELEELPRMYAIVWVKKREMGVMRRDSQTEIEAITDSGILTALATTYTDMETALDAITSGLGDAKIGTALDAAATGYGDAHSSLGLANTEFDKVVAASTGPLDLANVEFDKISALLDLGESDSEGAVTTALALIVTALAKVATIVAKASTENDTASTEIDAIFAGGTDGMWDDFDTAIADVQADIESAQNVLGTGPSGVANAVDDLLVAASATTPADQDAIQYLDNDQLPHAQVAIGIAQTRVQEAGVTVQSATAKLTEAQAELQNISSHGETISAYGTTVSNYIKEALAYIQEAQGHAAEIQVRLAQATTKREEGKARADSGAAFLAEARSRIEAGSAYSREAEGHVSHSNGYLSEAQGRVAAALGYAQEVSGRTQKAGVQLQECGIRIQTAQSYDQKSAMADKEATRLLQNFNSKLGIYIAQFLPAGPTVVRTERRSR